MFHPVSGSPPFTPSARHHLQARLCAHVTAIAHPRDPYFAQTGHLATQAYIQQQWQDWGETERHTVPQAGQQHHNLVLKLPGRETGKAARSPIVLGAHYDAVPGSPGADDNASGVAVLLELARYLRQYPARYPVNCVAFDLEEQDLTGSRQYVQQLQADSRSLRLMLSLEMLGYCDAAAGTQAYPHPLFRWLYPQQANYIGLIANIPTVIDAWHLGRAIQRAGVPCRMFPAGWRGQILPDTRRSDHAPFWDAGYRALMVTDTSFLRNPHYHQPSDRPETLDFEFMTGICIGLLHGLQTLK